MAAVTFDFATWIALYPEFAGCTSGQGQAWFDRADLYFANDVSNPAYDAATPSRFSQLLYLLTSHIAWLSAPRDPLGNPSSSGTPPPPLVGRVASAGEGSVNVSLEWKGGGSPSEEWFSQTPYGAAWWQATAQYRTFRYAAQRTVVPGTGGPFYGGYGRFFGRRW